MSKLRSFLGTFLNHNYYIQTFIIHHNIFTMRKLLLLTAGMLTALASQAAVEFTFTGDGTAANPYVLKTAADIVELADKVNTAYSTSVNSEYHCTGLYFELGADIDMTGITNFRGIGTQPYGDTSRTPGTGYYFGGFFDGKGYTISNMTIDAIEYDDNGKAKIPTAANTTGSYLGFIGAMGYSTAKNCYLKNINFVNASVKGYNYVAVAVGYVNSALAVFENIYTSGEVCCYNQYAAGILGNSATGATNRASINNCYNAATVKANGGYAGGIVGVFKGSITNCVNTGDVINNAGLPSNATGTIGTIGGIAGSQSQAPTATYDVQIANCVNTGNISNLGRTYAGGIVGNGGSTSILDCANFGNVYGDSYVGGIAGYSLHYNSSTVDYGHVWNCLQAGQVSGSVAAQTGVLVGATATTATTTLRMKGCYYDNQMCTLVISNSYTEANVTDTYGLGTAVMTSGALPDSLTGWSAAAGRYPVPATLCTLTGARDAVVNAASMYVTLPDGTTFDNVNKEGTISTAISGITATLSGGTGFTVSDGKLVPPSTADITTDTLTLAVTGVKRTFDLVYTPALSDMFGGGEGTEADPYLIKTPQHLQNLAYLVNDMGNKFDSIFFKQANDIDMAGVEFIGIGAGETGTAAYNKRSFAGIYDGGNFAIKNLTIDNVVWKDEAAGVPAPYGSNYCCTGLFGTITAGAAIRNVTLTDAYVRTGGQFVGGIVGYAIGAGYTYVDNCHVSGTVCTADTTTSNYAGGIVGYIAASDTCYISNCSMQGTIHAYAYMGGITSYGRGRISNCVNSATIYASAKAMATATAMSYVGGISGYAYGGSITNCLNVGSLNGQRYIGGILGGGSSASAVNALTIDGNVTIGRVDGQAGYFGAFMGNPVTSNYVTYANNYYDGQLAGITATSGGPLEGVNATPTDSLTAGTALTGLDAEYWTYTAGLYPQLKSVTTPDVPKAVATYFTIADGQSIDNFTGSAVISTAASITATLSNGNGYTIEDGKITAKHVSAITTDTLTLVNDGWAVSFYMTNIPSLFDGDGTAESPYLIKDIADWNSIVSLAEGSGTTFEGNYFLVTADLDWTDEEFQTLPAEPYKFMGDFNGGGHTFSNFSIVSETQKAAMFPLTTSSAKIHNIKFSNVQASGTNYIGILCALNYAVIDSISFDDKCAVTGTGTSGNVGTVAGISYGAETISNVTSYATVTGYKYVGGIIGQENTGGVTFRNCYNYGPVSATQPHINTNTSGAPSYNPGDCYAGGILGWGKYVHFINCENNARVAGETAKTVGGIVGEIYASGSVTDCANRGIVYSEGGYTAGIVGLSELTSHGYLNIKGCYNDCDTISAGNALYTAGILAHAKCTASSDASVTIDSCYNAARIIGRNNYGYTGGILGIVSSIDCTISDCYNYGDVEAIDCTTAYIGGIAGDCAYSSSFCEQPAQIIRCANFGNIDASSSTSAGYAAGIFGFSTAVIESCYNVGEVKGLQYVSGIANFATASAVGPVCAVKNCYNIGKVTSADTEKDLYTSNICGVYNAEATFSGNYFLSTLPVGADDAKGSAVTADSLMNAPMGDNYVYNAIAFPMVKTLADLDIAKVNAAYFLLSEGNTVDYVNDVITFCESIEGIEWTGTNFVLEYNKAYSSVESGVGTLTVTAGDYSKTYTFTITGITGIESVKTGAAADEVEVQYYNLLGMPVNNPSVGSIVIRAARHADGTVTSKKVIIR